LNGRMAVKKKTTGTRFKKKRVQEQKPKKNYAAREILGGRGTSTKACCDPQEKKLEKGGETLEKIELKCQGAAEISD